MRKATEEDAEAWMALQQKLHPGKDVSRPKVGEFAKAYVVLDRFTYPDGVDGANFFVPDDVPEPIGNPGIAYVYNFKNRKNARLLVYHATSNTNRSVFYVESFISICFLKCS